MGTPPMICPRCGIAMNHHAEKLIEPRTDAEAARIDPVLGGLVEEMHACRCGASASRDASKTAGRS
jgi:hypothetical protein